MRIALMTNPESGSGNGGSAERLLRAHGADVDTFALEDHAVAASRPDRIAVAGGDGSLGGAAEAAIAAGVPLAVVPAGTANDFARSAGLPDTAEDAARLAATGVVTRRLDLARIGRRPFLNVASVGLPSAAASKAHGLKRVLGTAAYAVGALRAAVTAQPVQCRAECDGDTVFEGEVWQATVACGGAFGGGAEIDADPGDGRLDLVVIEAGSRLGLVLRGWGLRRGNVETQRSVRSWRCSRISLDVPPQAPFNVDGEVVQAGGRIEFSVEPGALELITG